MGAGANDHKKIRSRSTSAPGLDEGEDQPRIEVEAEDAANNSMIMRAQGSGFFLQSGNDRITSTERKRLPSLKAKEASNHDQPSPGRTRGIGPFMPSEDR